MLLQKFALLPNFEEQAIGQKTDDENAVVNIQKNLPQHNFA